MVACFRYASIDVHSVYLPPHKLDFINEYQEWIQKEADEVTMITLLIFLHSLFDSLHLSDSMYGYLQVVSQAELLFSEVLNNLSPILDKKVGPELRHQIVELEGMLQREKAEFEVRLFLDVKFYCPNNLCFMPTCITITFMYTTKITY